MSCVIFHVPLFPWLEHLLLSVVQCWLVLHWDENCCSVTLTVCSAAVLQRHSEKLSMSGWSLSPTSPGSETCILQDIKYKLVIKAALWLVEKDTYTQKAALPLRMVRCWNGAEELVGCSSTETFRPRQDGALRSRSLLGQLGLGGRIWWPWEVPCSLNYSVIPKGDFVSSFSLLVFKI